MSFFKRISKSANSAADLSQALDETASELAVAEERIKNLEASRPRVLLEGTDAELDDIEDALVPLRRQVDRLKLGREELARRLTEAVEQERAAALDAQLLEAERVANVLAEMLTGPYLEAAAQITAIMGALHVGTETIRAANNAAKEANDPRRVERAQDRVAVRSPPQMIDGAFAPWGLLRLVNLPSLDHKAPRFWSTAEFDRWLSSEWGKAALADGRKRLGLEKAARETIS